MTRLSQLSGFCRRLARAQEGAAAVEAAFILPVLLLLLLGTIEVGRLAWTQAGLNYAVLETARCAVVRPTLCGAPAQAASYAAERVAPLNIPASAFTLTAAACGTQVRAAYDYKFLASAIFSAAPKLTAQACRA